MASRPEQLYDEDFYAWTREQAGALRRLAEQRWNGPLDLAHLAEEVEDLGDSERDAVRSRVRRILEHLLKLEHSPASEPRDGWKDTLTDARSLLEDKLTPSLRADLETVLPRLYAQMLPKAPRALRRFGEREAARALPELCPYTLDEIARAEWLPRNRHGIVDETD
jgi:Domain of unknown function DUF29